MENISDELKLEHFPFSSLFYLMTDSAAIQIKVFIAALFAFTIHNNVTPFFS